MILPIFENYTCYKCKSLYHEDTEITVTARIMDGTVLMTILMGFFLPNEH